MLGYFTPPCGNAQADAGQGIVGINPITWQRECISIADDGEIAQGQFFGRLDVSADGNRVVFASNATNLGTPPQNIFKLGLYVRDRRLRRTVRIDLSDTGVAGNDDADYARISKNGRWVVFTSKATNLVPNDTNGAQADIFRVDLNRFLPGPSTTVSPVPVPALSAWASMVTILVMLGLGLGMRRDRDA